MKVYYNEIDKGAAAWLRELMKEGLISDGEVDERSIEDVVPAELAGFDRCHFFAGIGIWDYALNRAGFEGKVWTGSCPCQPFSAAGKGEGFNDERHLWPAWFHLIEQCRPDTLFGEQVSSKDGINWLDLVHTDLEAVGYKVGALDIPAASVGAPHKRQRFYFVADAGWRSFRDRRPEMEGTAVGVQRASRQQRIRDDGRNGGKLGVLADTQSSKRTGGWGTSRDGRSEPRRGDIVRELVNAPSDRRPGERSSGEIEEGLQPRPEHDRLIPSGLEGRGFTNGFWGGAEWVYCNDPDTPRWRPIEPGTFPLVARTPGRVGLLRGYGNAINAQQAIAFIEAYLDTL